MSTNRLLLLGCVTAAVLATGAFHGPSAFADDGFVVVVNASNELSSVSAAALKKLCTGGTKLFDSGAVVQVGVIPGDAPETQYLAGVIGLSTRDLLARMQEQVFKGEMKRPTTLRTSADCAAFAAATPGGICVAAAGTPLPKEAKLVPVR